MRLFVALAVPTSWHAIVDDMTSVIAGLGVPLRRVDPALLHITVRFFDDVPCPRVEELDAALASHVPPVQIALALGRAGSFGAPARTSVAQLGITGDLDSLRILAHRAELATRLVGLPPPRARFSPHLTLARVARTAGEHERRAIAEAIAALPAPPPFPFIARELLLVHSILGRPQPRYEVISRYS